MTIPLDETLKALLKNSNHHFATLWEIHRKDGTIYYFTDNPTKVIFQGTEYTPTDSFDTSAERRQSELETQNIETVGILSDDAITQEDLRGGLYREAEILQIVVDPRFPWLGAFYTNKYWITEVKFTGEAWEGKVEGLTRWINPRVGRVYTRECDNDLGDAICRVDIGALSQNGIILSVSPSGIESRTIFTATGLAELDEYFTYGRLTWTLGKNLNLTSAVKRFTNLGGGQTEVELQIPTPFEIAVNDTFNIEPGCDKRKSTCINKYNNIENFGGFPFIPGTDRLMEAPRPK